MSVPPSVDRHAEKITYYRAREKASLAQIGSDPEINERATEEAQGWARLADARELIRKQLDDMAEHARRVRTHRPLRKDRG